MDDWYEGDELNLGNEPSPGNGGRPSPSAGGPAGSWHWLMTLVCLVTVAALSFLMAWLTKDILNRPSWIIGAIFTVPTLGMFLAALLLERKMSVMTPVSSRKMQYFVALIAILATFAVGCVFDIIYQGGTMGQVIENWAESHPPEKVYSDIVLMVDTSTSLADNGMDERNRQAITEWLNGMDDKARVGMIVFSSGVRREIPIDTLANNRQKLIASMDVETNGWTNFDVSLYHAYRMIDDAESGRAPGRTTQIIAITDAEAELPAEVMDALTSMSREKNVAFSIVHLGHDVPNNNPLMQLASATGGTGTSVGVNELSQYFESVQNAEEPDWDDYYNQLRKGGLVDFDLIRTSDPAANLLCGLMLGLEGLAIGICLMMMLSVTGQKRFQPVISLLMAAAAFMLLKVVGPGIGPLGSDAPKLNMQQWLLEGISFSLLGIVFMRKNNLGNRPASSKPRKASGAPDGFGAPGANDPFPGGAAEDDEW